MTKKQNNLLTIGLTVGIIAVLLFIGNTILSGDSQNTQSQEPIKIGVLGPLSGETVDYGYAVRDGYELALKEVNEEKIDGREIELVYEDTKNDPKAAIDATNKLINANNINLILGDVHSSPMLAAAPIAEQNEVIMLSSVATNHKISDSGDYIFRNVPSDALQGEKAAEVAYNRGDRDVAILYVNSNDYGVGLKEVFEEEFKELGGSIIATEGFTGGDTDFRTQLTKIKQTDADAVFLAGMLKEVSLILNQAEELGVEKQFITTEGIKDDSFFDLVGDSAEGVIFTSMKELDSPKAREFEEKYKSEYEREPRFFSDYAYDALKVLAGVMRQCENPEDTECVKNGLNDVEYEGATGLIDFDENGDVPKGFVPYEVEDRAFVPYEEE